MSDFGQFIKKARESKSMSVTSVAEQVGINHSHLSRVESGDRNPPKMPTLVKLAKVLNVPIATMLEKAGVVEDVGLEEANRLASYYVSDEEINNSILKSIKQFTDDEGFILEEYRNDIFNIFYSYISFTGEEVDFDHFYKQYLQTDKEDVSSYDEEHAFKGFNKMYNYSAIKRALKHLGSETRERLLWKLEDLAKTHFPSYVTDKTNITSVRETGMNFYGGSEQYTQDEIEVMEAALKAYREQKKKFLNKM
ncbi:helix-turn-helix domain-containing protein [Paenibacillus alvei]|uniref:Helix-turn-helix domain-containing protein n=1 Tax=Paenibacillus alvei TaxID=44250 RepID=A0ABT4H8U2_PAEAL|nr:helix-turn-helix transcriptional regulator [Paenibacillus alvei]MCY7485421.1 helix-turn-helix domain-containing protein [Paenibacillus alvei]MCY9544533.1 helix-turn-helix domain-containing protein [Paenibacillus alvei]MCY9706948.1 helix-turn-helix domain-containing protein [Paenibacillus alvei]MCY9736082.1 helix-turn-helix domain-containing protein [Paenibacillus alvei]MCY9755854.1 helix-turn-helix domain-containing protein [Paenibacillus alvei]